jgi:putative oxidoreductase
MVHLPGVKTVGSQTTPRVVAMTTTGFRNRTSTASSSLPDLGLLALRIAVAATMLQAGLVKAFDFTTTAQFMQSGGWQMPTFAAYLVTATEIAGGTALLLGLLTPLAACGVIAAMIDAWAVNVSSAAFWSEPFNVPFLLVFAATTLLCTGGGSYSIDARVFGRSRWPAAVTIGLFLVGIAAAVVTWVLLNGTNPLHVTKPTG